MAPKSQTVSSSIPLTIPKETNLLTIPSEAEAKPRYKCFVRFLNDSYLSQALTLNPTLYVDVLEGFWRTALVSTMAREDGTSFQEIACSIGGKHFQFGEKEINEALGFKVEGHDQEATDAQIVDFMTFIQYADEIDTGKLNKKFVRREWSFLFDALQKVFLCRKTGWDHISHIAVKLAYSLAYNQEINVGAIILKELTQRLGRTVRGRGNDIFYPRFLQVILNYLDANVHDLEGIDKSKMAYSKSMSKILFGSLDTRNQVDVILSVTPHMQDTFASYPLDKPIYHALSWTGEAETEGASQSNPSLPIPSSNPTVNTTVEDSQPSASISQKVDVTKKKKKRTLAIIHESVELASEIPESPLTRPKKKSKSVATTASSQQDSDVQKGVHLLLSMASQQVMGIEKSSLPTASCNESAQGQDLTLDPRSDKGDQTLSGAHINVETPPISQGELLKSNLNPTSLSDSSTKISSEQESHSHDNLALDQSQSSPVIEPTSSDMVLDTVLTTQDPHSVGQGMHAEAYPNDTNTNMEDSPVFTGDSVPNSPILRDVELSSQTYRADVVTHPISMEITSDPTAIPRLEETQTHTSHEVPSTSSHLAQATMSEWLKPVHHDRPSGSSSVPSHLTEEAIQNLNVAQIDEFSKIAQHLLTSNLPNADYEAILLCHKEDVEAQQEKIMNEAEPEGNVDAWLDSKRTVNLKDALAFVREEYLTSLGSNAKDLSPVAIYEAVNDVYKNQLKALHYLGKGLQSEISSLQEETDRSLTKLRNSYLSDFPKVDGILKEVQKTTTNVSMMDVTLAMVTDNIKKLASTLENQAKTTITTNAMLNVMWKNQYGDKLVDEVPLSDISKYDFARVKDQSLNSFKSQQLFSKVDGLEREVASLKDENRMLSTSLSHLNAKLDDQSTNTTNILLVQQQMMTSMMRSMNLPIPGETQDILSDPKPKGEKGKEVNVKKTGGAPTKQSKLKGKLIEETIKPINLPPVEVINAQGQKSTVTTTFYPSTMPKDISTSQPAIPTPIAKPTQATLITEAKLQEVANSNIYHDEAFLEFLKATYKNAQGDAQAYRKKLRESIKYFTVAVRKIRDVYLREIIMVCKDNCLWHLAFQTLEKLKFTEVSIILELIEKSGVNNKSLYNDLEMDQNQRLPEVIPKPRTVIFQSLSKVRSIDQLVIPKDLTMKNNTKINQVLQMLRAKKGVKTAEELEMINILQSFLIHGVLPESVTEKNKKKDGEDDDEEKTYRRRSHSRSDKDGPSDSSKSKSSKKSKDAGDDTKGAKETLKRTRSGIQQVKDIASSTLTTTQDSKSRVGTVSNDPPKSLSMTSEPELPQKKDEATKVISRKHFHKVTASGVLQWMKGKGMKLLPSDVALKTNSPCSRKVSLVKHLKIKSVPKRIRITKKTGKLTNVTGINVLPLDEDYDEDALAFLRAQRIFEVKVKLDHLEIKYTDGRERIMKQGSWQYFYKYELERINALLNFEEREERTWKIDIARYLKMHADYEENMRKENEKKKIQREKEMAEMEERAKELRQKGLCRVKQNPYIVEYKNSHGGQSKIRMEFLDSYVESALKAAIDDLEGSPLIEELIAREELQEAIIDLKRKEEIRKKKIYDDLLEKQLEAEVVEQQK
ncbi:hypothetical protein POM88_049136 [Heracleum sosnowskyi]|uniref:Uncharacterized protein n=1 Tax=Heracleum sosnowskyi TaxID=360622 RepID=A0AAD8GV36_9APIA|nr:hypothetical protein POM88_049136 [Heracleum sosnowskyi]